ncbi:MAG TPA: amylovoran biosynthesis protein AmsE [Clostridiales bacterium]|nr:amylovoran biosynthesis protein AmsE [Clostridiales bacterium]
MPSKEYSVLMSVYGKTDPGNLREALESIMSQTIPPLEIIIVEDGPVSPEVRGVISSFKETVRSVVLEKNSGLGIALNKGLSVVKTDLVARMDDDDISLPDRMEKELALFEEDPDLAIAGSDISEFKNDPSQREGTRKVPGDFEDIKRFSRKRNPFNHPSVMFSKKAVLEAGGYSGEYPLFEDYYLWVRLLMKGFRARNINTALLLMRTDDDTYKRRGGAKYAKDMLRFHRWMRKEGWSSMGDYLTGALPHAVICVLPNFLRRLIYSRLR